MRKAICEEAGGPRKQIVCAECAGEIDRVHTVTLLVRFRLAANRTFRHAFSHQKCRSGWVSL